MQHLQIPENWLVEVRSVYDLDYIKLEEINGPGHSGYVGNIRIIALCSNNSRNKLTTNFSWYNSNDEFVLNPVVSESRSISADIYDIAIAKGSKTID